VPVDHEPVELLSNDTIYQRDPALSDYLPAIHSAGCMGRSPCISMLLLFCNSVLWVYITEAYVRFAYVP